MAAAMSTGYEYVTWAIIAIHTTRRNASVKHISYQIISK